MRDQRDDLDDAAEVAPAVGSHARATEASRIPAQLDAVELSQKALAVGPEVPLHVRPVLNGYAEVQACGICSERSLRRHIATGRVKRSVIRNGRRLRFVVQDLIDELRQAEE